MTRTAGDFEDGRNHYSKGHGDQPEQVPNDNGYGHKMEYPGIPCGTGNCSAKFFSLSNKNAHIDFRHSESPKRQSQNDEWQNDYHGPSER